MDPGPKLLCALSLVEFPSADAGVEAGACSLLWEHRRREASGADAPHCPLSGLSDQRGKAPEKERKHYVLLITFPLLGTRPPSPDEAAPSSQAVRDSARPLTTEWEGNGSLCFTWQPCSLSPACGH